MRYRITFAALGIALSALVLFAGTGSSKATQSNQTTTDRALLTNFYNATGGTAWKPHQLVIRRAP